jgi:hypothetical protein
MQNKISPTLNLKLNKRCLRHYGFKFFFEYLRKYGKITELLSGLKPWAADLQKSERKILRNCPLNDQICSDAASH